MKTADYGFNLEKMPRELARVEVITDKKDQVRRYTPLRQVAQNLSRRGQAAAKVELLNHALATAADLCLECDEDGRLANVDAITGAVLVPLPWGEGGYRRWGLRVTEARALRYILRQRADRDRPPLFDYDAGARRWVMDTTWRRAHCCKLPCPQSYIVGGIPHGMGRNAYRMGYAAYARLIRSDCAGSAHQVQPRVLHGTTGPPFFTLRGTPTAKTGQT